MSTESADRVLVIDDDLELCELLREYLQGEGYSVETVQDGEHGVERALSGEHALAVVDVMLPGIDGFEVLRRIRARSMMPVLMLTARGDDVDRIVGLELGADDYLPKPFNTRELSARVRAVLRRIRQARESLESEADGEVLRVGDVELDTGGRVARCGGQRLDLTAAEFDMLAVLLRTAGKPVSRGFLFESVLDRKLNPTDRTVDMHVSNLRKKLGRAPERIKTIRGVGYVYTLPSKLDEVAEEGQD